MADIFSAGGGALADLFGSDAPPKAILNRYAAPTAKAGGALSTNLLKDVDALSKSALDQYLAAQPRMATLAGQQENVLQNILSRRTNADPISLLRDVGNTAFSFIDPNVVSPLAAMDVNRDIVTRRARGLNPAAVDSTSERLRNARIASGRFYDVARDVNANLPNLYGQAFNQTGVNDATAAGIIPQIQASYENLASRPTTGILNRINTAGAATGVGGQSIGNINAATQGFQQPRNWADRIGAASQTIGEGVSGTMGQIGQLAGAVGGAMGGGGGGL